MPLPSLYEAPMKKTKKKWLLWITVLLVLCVLLTGACLVLGRDSGVYTEADGRWRHVTARDSFGYVERHPAFREFSGFIQPWKDDWNLRTTPFESMDFVCRLNRTSTDSVLDGLNFVIDAAQENRVYYDFYTADERAQDPSKEETGLIVIPGERDQPTAVLSSGGAFRSVCLFLEGFPVARRLHQLGYSVAILKYRVDPSLKGLREATEIQGPKANEDYRRAIRFLEENQKSIGISMTDYSVWGFSAGGRLTAMFGLDNSYGYQVDRLPKPSAMVLAYSGWYEEKYKDQYLTMPPVYFAWLPEDDVIGKENVEGIVHLIDYLRSIGIHVEDKPYYKAKHGFGEGRGTDAEGWVDEAAAFWERMRASAP